MGRLLVLGVLAVCSCLSFTTTWSFLVTPSRTSLGRHERRAGAGTSAGVGGSQAAKAPWPFLSSVALHRAGALVVRRATPPDLNVDIPDNTAAAVVSLTPEAQRPPVLTRDSNDEISTLTSSSSASSPPSSSLSTPPMLGPLGAIDFDDQGNLTRATTNQMSLAALDNNGELNCLEISTAEQVFSPVPLAPAIEEAHGAMVQMPSISIAGVQWPPRDAESSRKLLNLVILLCAGLFTADLLVRVDMDVWRGWTWQEILLRIPYDNWREYEVGLTNHPIITKTIINVVIYLIGDWMSQVNWGRGKPLLEFDLGRTARNGVIGAFFGPLVCYYYDFSDWILPMDVPMNRLYKIIMDQTIYFISKCSVYIALVGFLRGDDKDTVVQDVKTRLWPIVLRGWKFWPLAHIVTYGVIPPRHRVLWVNMLDLLWSSILATLASSKNEAIAPPKPLPVNEEEVENPLEEERVGGPRK